MTEFNVQVRETHTKLGKRKSKNNASEICHNQIWKT